MKNIRKQTYSLEQYLKLMKDETIRSDQEVQRMSGQWNPNMVNELIATVLTDNYIPPIILGEETVNGIVRQWIIDGLQRSSSLALFRYGNVRITKNIEEYMVTFQRKVKDQNGNIQRDKRDEIVWETVEYDIRNKTYDQLPEELKDAFNSYQIELAIHQNCDTSEISKLVRKYNNHKAMNYAQKAFTYVDAFSREIRDITKNRFFLDLYSHNNRDRINGTFERVVGDMVLLCSYPDHYRKDTKLAFKWLNENATMADFLQLDDLLTRMTAVTENTKETRELFNSKNAYIFVAAFKAFTELGIEDSKFNDFMQWFVNGGNATEISGNTWFALDLKQNTRDSKVVHGKLDQLVALIYHYFTEIEKVA